jgi:hypothetical protein
MYLFEGFAVRISKASSVGTHLGKVLNISSHLPILVAGVRIRGYLRKLWEALL